MKDLLYDMANIYQQKALDSLDASDLAHAKRYREAADALEAKDKGIARLEQSEALWRDDYNQMKALCDQMGAEMEALRTCLEYSLVFLNSNRVSQAKSGIITTLHALYAD